MRLIFLTLGKVTKVDDDTWEWARHKKWHTFPNHDRGFYAKCAGRTADGRPTTVFLHRLIMQAPPGVHVDHIDGDTLNNQRSNLRLASRSLNKANGKVYRNNSSGYKGVHFHKREGKFSASIGQGGELVWLGFFQSAEEAARAYDRAALFYFGEFAKTNVSLGLLPALDTPS